MHPTSTMVKIDAENEIRKQLLSLLKGGQAHATFDEAVKDFPKSKRGIVPDGLPYSAWQLLEHLRIAQRDILDFSNNEDGSYRSLRWPGEYWPKENTPPKDDAWDESVALIKRDLAAFETLLAEGDLYTPFPWGDGQNLLREALLIADHAAYHIGEMVLLRRVLGVWK